MEGEGIATRKYDGTCCLIRDGKLYKRRELVYRKDDKGWYHPGALPVFFEPITGVDPNTGKQWGWIPIDQYDKWHQEVMLREIHLSDGTYELCGPKIQGNPEGFNCHLLIRHGVMELPNFLRDFKSIHDLLSKTNIEGVVWWHPDGRKAKIKGKDFGVKRR